MRKVLFVTLVISVLLVAASMVVAQPSAGIEIIAIDDTNFPTLQIFARVDGEDGRPVIGLTEADFEVLAEGRDANLVRVEEIVDSDAGLSVVLVVDSSESMFGQPLEDMKAAANILIDSLTAADEIAVIDFDGDVTLVQPFTTDFAAARAAVDAVTADGVTALYQASYDGIAEIVNNASNPRRVAVLVTDGHEFGDRSQRTRDEAPALALENNIPMFAVGFGSVFEPYLRQLGEGTGGQTYILPSSSQLSDAFQFISNFLRSQYILTLEPALEPDGTTAVISVRTGDLQVSQGYQKPDLYPSPATLELPSGPIDAPVTVPLNVTAPRGFGAVNVAIDGQPVEVADGAFNAANDQFSGSLVIDPLQSLPGDYTLSVEAIDQLGAVRSVSQGFTIAQLPLTFAFSGLTDGEVLEPEGTRALSAEITQSQGAVQNVTFSLNGEVLAVDTEAPYSADLALADLAPGTYTLTTSVTNVQGQTVDQRVSFTIPAPPTPTPTPIPPTATPTLVPPTVVPTSAPLTFSVSGLEMGAVVSEPALAVSAIDLPPGIDQVTFVLDGQTLDVDSGAPYISVIDVAALAPGAHILEVIAAAEDGRMATVTLPFTVAEPTAAPTFGPFNVAPFAPSAPEAAATLAPLSFSLSGLEMGAEVTAPVLSVRADGLPAEMESVTFAVDGETVDVDSRAPYAAVIDVAALEAGAHILDVSAVGLDGAAGSVSIPFTVAQPAALLVPTATDSVVTADPTATEVVATRTVEATVVSAAVTDVTSTEVAAVEATTAAPADATVEATDMPTTVAAEVTAAEPTATTTSPTEVVTDEATAEVTGAAASADVTPTPAASTDQPAATPLNDLLLPAACVLLLGLLAAAWFVMRQRSKKNS